MSEKENTTPKTVGKSSKGAKRKAPTKRLKTRFLALEPRVVFDGALAVDIVDKTVAAISDFAMPDSAAAPAAAPDFSRPSAERTATDKAAADAQALRDANALNPSAQIEVAADPAGASAPTEMLFIDGGLSGLQQLLSGVRSDIQVVILDPARDGFSQITEALAGRSDIAAVHLVTHGDPGQIAIGSSFMSAASLYDNKADVAKWGASLSAGADFLIYGCDAGQGVLGQGLLTELSGLTGADSAASTNLTGGGPLGSDWNLEVSNGEVLARPFADAAALAAFNDLLGTPTVDLNGSALGAASDNFSSNGYAGGTGWLGSTWTEFDASPTRYSNYGGTNSNNSPDSGNIVMASALTAIGDTSLGSAAEVAFIGHGTQYNDYIQRTIDLRDYTTATLSFTYRMSGVDASDVINVDISNTGGQVFTTFSTLTNVTGNTTKTITFNSTSGFAFTDDMVVRFTVAGGYSATTDRFFLDNVSIVADGNNYHDTFTEGGSSIAMVGAAATVTDPTNAQIKQATVTLSNMKADDVIAVGSLPSGITATFSTTSVANDTVTFSGIAQGSDYATALKSLSFSNTAANPDTTTRVFNVQVMNVTDELSAVSNAFVRVVGVDTPIVTVADTFATTTYVPISGNVLANDSDPDAVGALQTDTTLITQPANGTVTIDANGNFTYTPTASGTYTDTFQYRAISMAQVPGTNYQYWNSTPAGSSLKTGFPTGAPDNTGFMSGYNVDKAAIDAGDSLDTFTVRFTSSLVVTTAGTYTFYTGSDDGSVLYVDGVMVVDNDGAHSYLEQSGAITLSAGSHVIRVDFFEIGGQEDLFVAYAGADTGGQRNDLGAAVGVLAPNYQTGTVTVNVTGSTGPRLALSGTVSGADNFATAAFSNNTGTINWSGNWVETDSGGAGTGSGDIRVTGGELQIRDRTSGGGLASISREIDLLTPQGGSPAPFGATLSFDYDRTNINTSGRGNVVLEISGDGGTTWTTLDVFDYTDAATGTRSYDVSAYIATNTEVRFRAGADNVTRELFVDNLQVTTRQVSFSGTYTENGTAVAVAGTGAGFDTGGNLSGATVTLSNSQSLDLLSISPADRVTLAGLGISASADSASAITLSGTASRANYAAALQLVKFSSTSENPSTVNRTIAVSATDASSNVGNTAYTTIAVTRVNDAPDAANNSVSTPLNTTYIVLKSDFGFTDVDGDSLNRVRVTALPAGAAGTLQWFNGSAWVSVTVNQYISAADVDLGRLRFAPTASYNGGANFQFQVEDNSGAGNNLDTTANTLSITVLSGANTAPTLANAGTLAYVENGAAATLGGAIAITDDGTQLSGATVTITAGTFVAGDILSAVTAGTNITASYAAGTGVLTLSGADTKANYQAVLQSIKYNSTSENPTSGGTRPTRAVNYQVTDTGGLASNSLASTVNITAVNDAAIIGGTSTGLVREDGTATATGTLTISDADSATTFGVQTSVAGTYGNFSVTAGGAWTYNLTANASAAVQALTAATTLTDSFTVTSADGTTKSIAVTIAGTNDAPSGTNKTITTILNTAYVFSVNDFGFVDNIDAGDALNAVRVTTTPAAGTIQLFNGSTWNTVAATTYVSATDIAAGNLRFNPATGSTTTRTFTFQVQDGGGTANGGVDLDASANTMTININAANTAPVVAGSGTLAYTENGVASAINSTLTVTDDSPTLSSATVSITANYNAAQDVLAFANDGLTMGNIAVSTNAGGVLTLTSSGGTATLSQWQAALRAVKYSNSSDAPTTTARTVAFAVNDGSLTSSAVTSTVNINAVNDTPMLGGAFSTLAYTEAQTAQVIDAAITLTDPDSPANFNGGYLQAGVTVNGASQDQISVVPTGGITVSGANVFFSAVQIGTIDATLNGVNGQALKIALNSSASGAAVQALGRAIGYSNSSNVPLTATRTVSFVFNDGANAGSGPLGGLSVTKLAAVTITAVAPGAPMVALSSDTGSSGADKITSNAALTVTTAESGGTVQYSSNGTTWSATAPVPSQGANTVYVRQVDSTGLAGAATTFTYTYDSTAPNTPVISSVVDNVGTIQGTVSSGGVSDDTVLVLNGTAEANSTVTIYDGATVLGTATANGSGVWTFTTGTLTGGTAYAFNARATDAAGNQGTGTANYTVTVDATAPTVSVADNVAGTANASTGNVAYTYTFSESVVGLTAGDFTVTNGTISSITGSGTTWTVNVTPGAGVASGNITMALVAGAVNDTAGNVSAANTNALQAIDTVAPNTPVISSVVDNVGTIQGTVSSGGVTDDTVLVLNGTAEANSTVTIYDGATVLGTVTANGSGVWTYTTGTLTGGTAYAFNARATDAAGNQGSGTANYTVTVDTAAPAVTPLPGTAPLVDSPPVTVTSTSPIPTTTPTPSPATSPFGGTTNVSSGPAGLSAPTPNPTSVDSALLNAPVNITGGLGGTFSAQPAAPSSTATADFVNALPATAGGSSDGASSSNASEAGFPVTRVELASGANSNGVTAAFNSNEQRLFVYEGVVDAKGTDQFKLPKDAFAHTDSTAIVKLEARQVDGEPLPAWVQFNSITGQFQGTPPAEFANGLDVQVTARDTEGREASIAFKLELGTQSSDSSQQTAVQGPRTAGATDGVGAGAAGIISGQSAGGSVAEPAALVAGVSQVTGSAANGLSGPAADALNGLPATGLGLSQAGVSDLDASDTGFPVARVAQAEAASIVGEGTPDTGEQRLFVFGGVVDGRGTDQFQVPREAFAHTDPSAIVKLEARLIDGAPLPPWLQFNSVTGQFQGTPPAGVSGGLDVEITARDADGREASVSFKLELGVPASELSRPIFAPAVSPQGGLAPTSPGPTPDEFGITTGSGSGSVGDSGVSGTGAQTGSTGPDATLRIDGEVGTEVPPTGAFGEGQSVTKGFAVFRVTEEADGLTPVALSDIQARLFVYQGINGAVGFDQYQIPREAFAHTDPSAIVTLNARLATGAPLPSWLSFDSTTGIFRGTPPGGVPVSLELILTALDAEGREASVEFMLELGVKEGTESTPRPIRVDANAAPMILESDELEDELDDEGIALVAQTDSARAVAEKAVKAVKPGANSFADQLRAAKVSKDPVLAKALESKQNQVTRLGS